MVRTARLGAAPPPATPGQVTLVVPLGAYEADEHGPMVAKLVQPARENEFFKIYNALPGSLIFTCNKNLLNVCS